MPFLYKPKFCCQCGETVERVEWKLWTSRRFCTVCESVQKQHDLMPRAVIAVGLIAGLFGISGFMTRPGVDTSKPIHTVSTNPAVAAVNKAKEITQVTAATRSDSSLGSQSIARTDVLSKQETVNSSKKKIEGDGAEDVYFCGAATKKGTPCSRRVKTPGRCWQHTGQPSMIPAAKLRTAK